MPLKAEGPSGNERLSVTGSSGREQAGKSEASQPDLTAAKESTASLFDKYSDTTAAKAELRRTAARGLGHTFVLSGAEFVLRLLFTAVLARLISPEQFGLVMLVTAVTAIADNFRDLGLSTATIQREHVSEQQVSNLFWINTAAGVALALIVCALAPAVSMYFREPRLTAVTMALASTFVLGGLSVQHEALLGRQMRLGPKGLMRLAAFVVSSAAASGLAVAGYGYWALVWREIVRSALIVVGAWSLCRWVPSRPRRDTDVRELVKFGSGLTATYMLGALASSLDRFLLGRIQGAEVVGLYRQSYQLVVAPMSQLMGPLYQVSLPSLSMLQQEPKRFARTYTRIVSIVAMVSMPLSVLTCVWAEEIASVMLGPRWAGAAIYIRMFALGGLLQSVFSTIGFVLVSRGLSSKLLRISTAQVGLRACLMCVGAAWGGLGVATAEVSSTAIAFLPYLRQSLKGSPVSARAFLESLARPFGGSVVLLVVLVALKAGTPAAVGPTAGLALALMLTVVAFPAGVALMPGGVGELTELTKTIRALLDRRHSSGDDSK
jgi:O-antigen/teichoic acid export membrane protein